MNDGGACPLPYSYICNMKTVYAVRDGKVVDVTNEPKQVKERAFHINIKGSGGLKWLNKSQNKTWVNGNKVYKMKEGDPTNQ